MSKLTKTEARNHQRAQELLTQDVLGWRDKRFVLENWREDAEHLNGVAGAFFTPWGLALDVALHVVGDRVIDLCAGIGTLSLAYWWRTELDRQYGRRLDLVCVEANPAYVAVGRKILPEATWICADVLDPATMTGLGVSTRRWRIRRSGASSAAAVPVQLTGSLVFSFGTALAGRGVLPATLLEAIPARRLVAQARRPTISPESVQAGLQWWTGSLNALLGVVSDPARFTDTSGVYRPMAHLETQMSLGALFRRVAAAQITTDQGDAALAMLFASLDILPSLTGIDMVQLCNPDYADKKLDALHNTVPAAAHELLLPGAKRAVEALRSVADGFYLPLTDGRIPAGPAKKPMTPAVAVAQYLHLQRNTTHGFSSSKKATDPARHQLLARHTGELSGDLPLLGYLYLLDLLATPDLLDRTLDRRRA